jgi:hypothetical protein
MKALILFTTSLLLCLSASAQVTTIQGSDAINTSRTTINSNFSYLDGQMSQIKCTATISSTNIVISGTGCTAGSTALSSSSNASAETTQDIALFTLPANSILTHIKMKHSTAFAGTGISGSAIVYAQVVPDSAVSSTIVYSDRLNVQQTVANTALYVDGGGTSASDASHSVKLRIVSPTNVAPNAITAGVVNIWIVYKGML